MRPHRFARGLSLLATAWLAAGFARAAWAAPQLDPGPGGQSGAKQQAEVVDPDALLLPDLQTLPPSDLNVRLLGNGRRVLRLANTVWNSGDGPLELAGALNTDTGMTQVHQRLHALDGTWQEVLVGEFVFHLGHDHWHTDRFAEYHLWSLTPTGAPGRIVATSAKLSYCVIDTDAVDREHPAFENRRRYYGCGRELQGLSPGWGDKYKHFLEGQSIDITDVPDGLYALVSTANPDARLIEADYGNNTATIYLTLAGRKVEVVEGPGRDW
jgi:hypothetical protein